MKRTATKLPYIPRVLIKMNTGTKVIFSKKDKMMRRSKLNKFEWT